MWRTSILPTLKCNLVLWDRGWEKHTTGTQPYFSFSFTPFSFCVWLSFLLSNSHTFLLSVFKLTCRPALIAIQSSQFLLYSLPFSLPLPQPLSLCLSPATWYGCQVIDGCVGQSHESCFYSEGLTYKPSVILGYRTNKLWPSRKSISYIDKHRHTHECMHARNEVQTETDTFVRTYTQFAQRKQQTFNRHVKEDKHLKTKTSTNINMIPLVLTINMD